MSTPFDILGSLQKTSSSFDENKPSTVQKAVPANIDLGNLLIADYTSELNLSDNNVEEQLINMTRDNVQLLINDLFSLVRRTDTDGTFVELPLAVMALPRAKPLPDSVIKEKTKWEQFAERKGIKRKVTDRNAMVYDDDHKDYLPRHGAKSAKNQPLADWCEELN